MTLEDSVAIEARRFDAVVFDMDGVVTDTAGAHRAAWKQVFDAFLFDHAGPDAEPFAAADYLEYVDGKPRYDGVRSFLDSRGITLPEGTANDPPDLETVCGLGNRKDDIFRAHLAEHGANSFTTTVDLIDDLHRVGIRTALITSSRNAEAVLQAAGLAEAFEVVIDGTRAMARGLAGKPAPDVFLAAAEDLGIDPNRTVVVEDAVSGVAAGRAGRFGLVIGVARHENEAALRAAGAHVVVSDLATVSVAA
jgi:beta-phosphoglucomutase family hydrolase